MYFGQDNCELIFKQRDNFAGFHNIDQTRVFILEATRYTAYKMTNFTSVCATNFLLHLYTYIYGGVTGL